MKRSTYIKASLPIMLVETVIASSVGVKYPEVMNTIQFDSLLVGTSLIVFIGTMALHNKLEVSKNNRNLFLIGYFMMVISSLYSTYIGGNKLVIIIVSLLVAILNYVRYKISLKS